ncbi:unnamed protein product [Peronospora belbahrii]|uniref:Uncharacterized protein n=1 Tax=Peronospora belbahrii TaxID=622444 RepID=A0ABN8CV17_9STRA|nr:unnamed protein product [Peronospora belbahrii]
MELMVQGFPATGDDFFMTQHFRNAVMPNKQDEVAKWKEPETAFLQQEKITAKTKQIYVKSRKSSPKAKKELSGGERLISVN